MCIYPSGVAGYVLHSTRGYCSQKSYQGQLSLSQQRYVGIGRAQSVRGRCVRLLPCWSTTEQAAIREEVPSKLRSYQCFLLARLNLGAIWFYFGLFGF